MHCFNTGNTAENQPEEKKSLPLSSDSSECKPKLRLSKAAAQTIRTLQAATI